MLGTYRLQDPNGVQLASLVHGNRLLNAKIHSADELRRLWAAPAVRDQLRRRNKNIELMPSDEIRNTELLEHYLVNDDGDDLVPSDNDLDGELAAEQQPLLPSESSMEIDDSMPVPMTTDAARPSEQEDLERPRKRPRQAPIQESRRSNRPRVPNRRYQ